MNLLASMKRLSPQGVPLWLLRKDHCSPGTLQRSVGAQEAQEHMLWMKPLMHQGTTRFPALSDFTEEWLSKSYRFRTEDCYVPRPGLRNRSVSSLPPAPFIPFVDSMCNLYEVLFIERSQRCPMVTSFSPRAPRLRVRKSRFWRQISLPKSSFGKLQIAFFVKFSLCYLLL